MTRNEVINDYFNWLSDFVYRDRFPKRLSYRKLLTHLHDTEFIYSIPKDKNRAEDGKDLRYRYAYNHLGDPGAERYLSGPCSVLEMMIGLTIRCEETIMDDTSMGDRTGQWFWGMIVNLGLGAMSDARFDRQFVEEAISDFLNRRYEPDGRGGLFRVKNCDCDLRNVEIWVQMLWYLDSII